MDSGSRHPPVGSHQFNVDVVKVIQSQGVILKIFNVTSIDRRFLVVLLIDDDGHYVFSYTTLWVSVVCPGSCDGGSFWSKLQIFANVSAVNHGAFQGFCDVYQYWKYIKDKSWWEIASAKGIVYTLQYNKSEK